MEEILASIKRVIRDDGRAPPQPRASRRSVRGETPLPSVAAVPDHDDDVLELDQPAEADDGLVSEDVAASSRQSLAALSAVRQREASADGSALEALVREMLRPVLKQWLDEHLPLIVEELVTREISRITGRSI